MLHRITPICVASTSVSAISQTHGIPHGLCFEADTMFRYSFKLLPVEDLPVGDGSMVRAFHVLMWLLYICVSQVKERLKKMGTLQPLNIFLRQEIDRMQKVIVLVRATLNDLKLAIDGTIIMSENLRDALDCMYDARVPSLWRKVRVASVHCACSCTCTHERGSGIDGWFKHRTHD